MTLHYEDAGLRLFHGSNKDVLGADALGYPHDLGYHPDRLIPDESYDSIVTDPPYELGFMGKGWDSTGIAYDVDLWRECWRVLKPGGYLLSFGGSRTWHRITVAIEDAGFEIRDSIAWMYGSGFPKSMNVAKAITGLESGHGSNSGAIRRATMGDAHVPSGRLGNRDGAGRRDTGLNEHELELTESAKTWDGWGTALKPAFEPIVVARKPLAGTVAANVLAYGTGALNIDACRVGTMGGTKALAGSVPNKLNAIYGEGLGGNPTDPDAVLGRFPPNVLLDESQAGALDEQSGVLTSGLMKARTERQPRPGGKIYGADKRNIVAGDFAGSGTTGEAALLEGMEVDLIELEAPHLPLILQRVRKPLQPSMFGDWEMSA